MPKIHLSDSVTNQKEVHYTSKVNEGQAYLIRSIGHGLIY